MDSADSESRIEWFNRCCELQNALGQAEKTVKALEAENAKRKEAYNEIFENYIPSEKMDDANNRLNLLLEDREQMGRDMLKAHPLKGESDG